MNDLWNSADRGGLTLGVLMNHGNLTTANTHPGNLLHPPPCPAGEHPGGRGEVTGSLPPEEQVLTLLDDRRPCIQSVLYVALDISSTSEETSGVKDFSVWWLKI